MAEWTDKTIDKPKEPHKQKTSFVNQYNDYGFDYNSEMYSIPEEVRDFRKKIQHEIVMEELKTQNILGQHITDEINRNIDNTDTRAREINENIDNTRTELKQAITNVNNYIVNTVYPKIETVDGKVDSVKTTVESNNSIIRDVWNKVRNWG